MEENKPQIKYGSDEMTMKINVNPPDRKTEDWHCDYNAKIVIDGVTYFGNLYDKNGDASWMVGKIKKAKDEDLPF